MKKTKQLKPPCAHMARREDSDVCNRRCGDCKREACIFDDYPVCSLLSANDRTVPCPFVGEDENGNANVGAARVACKKCPLPAYHESDPVTSLLEAGLQAHLDDIRETTGCCLDEACLDNENCITHSEARISMCHTIPNRLRLMYLGAEWRRRNT